MGACLSRPASEQPTNGATATKPSASAKPTNGSVKAGKQLKTPITNGHVSKKDLDIQHISTTALPAPVKEEPKPDPDDAGGYMGAPAPENEEERHGALCKLGMLDSEPDPRFDDVTRLLCSIFDVPIAVVSLVDTNRQWFKSIQGLGINQTGRKVSFCAWTLLPKNPEVLIVTDATLDDRFRDNPLVTGAPGIRFYAGAPLVLSSGLRLGSLCVIDLKPRTLDAEQLMVLCNFAEVIVREIEKEAERREDTKRLDAEHEKLSMNPGPAEPAEPPSPEDTTIIVDLAKPEWKVLFTNESYTELTGIKREQILMSSLFDFFGVPGQTRAAAYAAVKPIVAAKDPFDLELIGKHADTSQMLYIGHFKPAATEVLNPDHQIGIPGFADWPADRVKNIYILTLSAKPAPMPISTPSAPNPAIQQLSNSPTAPVVQPALRNKQPWPDVELGPLIGQGSFGKVYRGQWEGKHVAVKIISMSGTAAGTTCPADRPATPTCLEDGTPSTTMKGALEAIHSVDLDNPSIVATYKSSQRPAANSGYPSDMPAPDFTETWLLLEFCDKGNLQDAVDRGIFNLRRPPGTTGVSVPDVAAIIATAHEIASALAYLHARHILHGDLAGGNILLASSDKDHRGFCSKVADFGLARVQAQEAISTGTFGTVTHMPPELLTTGQLSKAVDVYAFGVLLWEMCTGARPWAGMMQMQIIFHVTIQKKRLTFPDTVPGPLRELGEACMHNDYLQRPLCKDIVATLEAMDSKAMQQAVWDARQQDIAAATAAAAEK